MNTAKSVIRNAIDAGLISQYADDYAEPGCSLSDGQIGVLFANWNDRSHYDHDKGERVVDDNTMPRLAKVAERAGYETEWEDEWTTCYNCNKAVRTNANSYDWQASYAELCGDIVCRECIDPVEYLESLEGNASRGNTFAHIDPAEHGYVLLKEGMEHGWHPGQNDSPKVVAKSLRALGVHRFLFVIDSVGQFDLSFSVYVHESEADLAREPTSALPYDPGTEMAKALRGEQSDVYRMETRTLTAEEFVSGKWVKGE